MKTFFLILALLFAAPAAAQQVTCATRPVGDNTNACASTAFVLNTQAAQLPAASTIQLYGGTGAAGSASVISLGSGLSLAGGTLSATLPMIAAYTILGNATASPAIATPLSALTLAPALGTGVTAMTLGADPVLPGDSVLWTTSPTRIGGVLSLTTNEGNNSTDEFLTSIMSSEVATPTYIGTTNASTSTSSNVLHFATNPTGILVGMSVSDQTSGALTGGQTITNIAAGAVTISSNANATVNSGDVIAFGYPNFKGPLFLSTESADYSTSNFTRASNGLTIYSGIKNGATNGYAEGIVDVTQENGTGQGLLISGEFDISPDSATNSAHCDASGVSACHTNIWMYNFGTKAGSWMIDTGVGGAGWNNGISIRNITGGGPAILIPNSIAIVSENAANTAYVDLAFADVSSNAVYGYGANSTVIASHMASSAGTGAAPAVSSCGTSPSLAAGSTDTKGVITVGSGTVTNCTLTFHVGYAGAPACVLTGTNAAAPLVLGVAPVVTGFYFNSGATNIAGQQVSYICMQ